MKVALGIFAKTIGLSPVKTRLAADLGIEKAERFYQLSVAAIENVVSDFANLNDDFYPHWALAEKEAVGHSQWQTFPTLWTGEGGLGERLATISEKLFEDHDAVILIGTDSPQLGMATFGETVEFLERSSDSCIVGPAKDGGFYLFASRKPISRKIWESVSYSSEATLSELQRKIEVDSREVICLAEEQDVDNLGDLRSLKARLMDLSDSLSPDQLKLLEWLNTGT